MKSGVGEFHLDYMAAYSQLWDRSIAIGIVGDKGGKPAHFDGEKYCEHPEGGRFDPAFLLRIDQAQHLANSLWEAGIQPKQAKGSVGQLQATERHLQDMRSLVFNKESA